MGDSIDFKDLKLGDVIGEGTFGKVYHAKCRNKDRAVKQIYTNVPDHEMQREYKQLGRASHKNIIFLYGVAVHDKVHYMVMEYAEGGSLFDLLHKSSKPDYTFDHFINWVLHSAMAVEYLHSLNVIHRDLKPHNILLTDQRRCPKVCDFGTVREKATTMTRNRGTAAYMAPEVFKGKSYTEKCDVFSLGLCMIEILSRKIPYEHETNDIKICEHVKRGERPPTENLYINSPSEIIDLIKSCWSHDDNMRPTMAKIIEVLNLINSSKGPFDYDKLSL